MDFSKSINFSILNFESWNERIIKNKCLLSYIEHEPLLEEVISGFFSESVYKKKTNEICNKMKN